MKNSKKEIIKVVTNSLGIAIEPSLVMALQVIVDGAIGQLASGLSAAKNSYKFKRLEENMEAAINDLYEKFDNLEKYLIGEKRVVFTEKLLPTFWDYIIDEPEKDKIQLFVNGLAASLKQEEINMDKMFIYFEILKQLRLNEIKYFLDVVVNQNYKITESSFNGRVCPPDLDIGYHDYVFNKLRQLGLINQTFLDANGTLDKHFSITDLGNDMMNFFKSNEQIGEINKNSFL